MYRGVRGGTSWDEWDFAGCGGTMRGAAGLRWVKLRQDFAGCGGTPRYSTGHCEVPRDFVACGGIPWHRGARWNFAECCAGPRGILWSSAGPCEVRRAMPGAAFHGRAGCVGTTRGTAGTCGGRRNTAGWAGLRGVRRTPCYLGVLRDTLAPQGADCAR